MEPSLRGEGLGGGLLQQLAQHADVEGRCMFLAATSEDNRRLYLRHGFTDVEHRCWGQEGAPGCVNLYFMERLPLPLAAAVQQQQ